MFLQHYPASRTSRLAAIVHRHQNFSSRNNVRRTSRMLPFERPPPPPGTFLPFTEIPPQNWTPFSGSLGPFPPLPNEYPPAWVNSHHLHQYYTPLLRRGWWLSKCRSPGHPDQGKVYQSMCVNNQYYLHDNQHRAQFCRAIPRLIADEKPFDLGYLLTYHSDGIVEVWLHSPNALHPRLGHHPGLTLADIRAAHKVETLLSDDYAPKQGGARPWRGKIPAAGNIGRKTAVQFLEDFATRPVETLERPLTHSKPHREHAALLTPQSLPSVTELREFTDSDFEPFLDPLFSRGWMIKLTTELWVGFRARDGHMDRFHSRALALRKTWSVDGSASDFNSALDTMFESIGCLTGTDSKVRITFGDGKIVVALYTKNIATTIAPLSGSIICSISNHDIARAIDIEARLSRLPGLRSYSSKVYRFRNKSSVSSMVETILSAEPDVTGD